MAIFSRLMHAWNAFMNQDARNPAVSNVQGATYGIRPDRNRPRFTNERSIIQSVYTRLSMDVAGVILRHARTDGDGNYLDDIDSGLTECLTVQANIDQGARQFRQDIALTLFDKGVAAIVPVDTTVDPSVAGSWDIKTLRVGEITGWMSEHVRIMLYNEAKTIRQEITLPKKMVAIVENPFFQVMNEPSSTLQRLIRKLNLLDAVDEQTSSGKLDIIIQLPYVVKSDTRRQQAMQRRQDLEFQLKGSQYGIAYIDGTEKVTQLNRPAENNLLKQVEYLTAMLYSQLGLTTQVMDGSADEATMLNYMHRTIEPIVDAIAEAMRRSFLTKTARSQGQDIVYSHNPFTFVSLKDLAEIVDKFTRNEVLSANEVRGYLRIKPSKDPKANELRNSNMPDPNQQPGASGGGPSQGNSPTASAPQDATAMDGVVNDLFQGLSSDIDSILGVGGGP